jgi:hypothetical protein
MKTNILIIFITINLLGISALYAQDKDQPAFSVKLYSGYSLFTPGSSQHGISLDEYNDHYSQTKLGSGAGANFGIGLTVPVGKLWMVGLDAGYLAGSKANFKENGNIDNEQQLTTNYYTKASVLSITPNISYKVYNAKNYFIYTKAGIIIAANTKYNYHYYLLDQTADNTSYITENEDYKYGLTFGFQSGAGVQFKLTKHLSGFGELTGNFLTIRPKSSTDVENGVTPGETIVYSNFIQYYTYTSKKSGTFSSGTSTTTTAGNTTTIVTTGESLSDKQHINNVVLNVGLVYGFK